ncbi:MAG: N-acetylmuramoyl-L-alanine amidase, partial [Lachnospiraceae bacterium]|nr:N-acetylmuramoyl-L-alanine amidase [Lachnospiraceae bacterium]
MQRIYVWGKYILGLFVLTIALLWDYDKCYAEEYIVVLDPGHGGEALGGQTEEYIEQEINLITARAMYDRLCQYEGITVYLTHDEIGEVDISRTDRAKIAAEYDADYLISLHYNMSANHNLYGTEVWTSAFGNEYSFGQTIGTIITNDLSSEFGLFNRGVKVRLNNKRDDYYGIIQLCRKEGIPSIIIEHCHLDSEKDRAVLGSIPDIFVKFGEKDADAVAKYLRLKSSSLGIDYSDYQYDEVIGSDFNPLDESEPEYVNVRINSSDIYNKTCNITIEADDSNGRMQYYSISLDGGNTFGKMLPWSNDISALNPEDVKEINADIELIPGIESRLVVRGYNQYELYTDSS